MPPTIRKDELRQAQGLFVNPQRTIRSVATGQQGGHSGTIPGTDSDPTQLGMQWSTIQPPDTGDQVAAVGHAVLANDGSPVVVMGNMAVSGDSGYPPEGFQDGGFVFTDAEGNAVAGYSHPTGLWGFGKGTIVVNRFPFAYNTAGLLDGVTCYSPSVDNLLIDAWFEISEGWNTSGPPTVQADIGQFIDSATTGLYNTLTSQGGQNILEADSIPGGGAFGSLVLGQHTGPLSLIQTLAFTTSLWGNLLSVSGSDLVLGSDLLGDGDGSQVCLRGSRQRTL